MIAVWRTETGLCKFGCGFGARWCCSRDSREVRYCFGEASHYFPPWNKYAESWAIPATGTSESKTDVIRRRFLGRGCDEALFSEKKVFAWKGGRHSVHEGFGKDVYRKGDSVKRSRPCSEPPHSENWKVVRAQISLNEFGTKCSNFLCSRFENDRRKCETRNFGVKCSFIFCGGLAG